MINPKVSVVIPVYNAEQYLNQCLESVLNQTLENIEIICINDGSTDLSLEIIGGYKKADSRIKVINTEHFGCNHAYNTGFKQAKADFIGVVDADDWVENNMFESLHNAIVQNNVGIVVCNTIVHVEIQEDPILPEVINSLKFYWSGKNTINSDIHYCSNGYLWNKLFRKSIINKYNLQVENLPVHSDDLFYKSYCSVAETIYYLEMELYNYVRRPFSLSSFNKIKKTSFPKLLVFDALFDFYKRCNIFEKQKENFWKYFFIELVYILGKKNSNNTEIQKDILNNLSVMMQKVELNDIVYNEKYKNFFNLVKMNCYDECLNIIKCTC